MDEQRTIDGHPRGNGAAGWHVQVRQQRICALLGRRAAPRHSPGVLGTAPGGAADEQRTIYARLHSKGYGGGRVQVRRLDTGAGSIGW